MSRWLARLAFSFFILAGLLFYQAYREMNDPAAAKPPVWRIALYCLAAGLSIGLGFKGLRERHKMLSDSRDDLDERNE